MKVKDIDKDKSAENLMFYAKTKGVSLYRIAEETGVPLPILTRWRQGIFVPSVKNLKAVADYFGVKIDDLI